MLMELQLFPWDDDTLKSRRNFILTRSPGQGECETHRAKFSRWMVINASLKVRHGEKWNTVSEVTVAHDERALLHERRGRVVKKLASLDGEVEQSGVHIFFKLRIYVRQLRTSTFSREQRFREYAFSLAAREKEGERGGKKKHKTFPLFYGWCGGFSRAISSPLRLRSRIFFYTLFVRGA